MAGEDHQDTDLHPRRKGRPTINRNPIMELQSPGRIMGHLLKRKDLLIRNPNRPATNQPSQKRLRSTGVLRPHQHNPTNPRRRIMTSTALHRLRSNLMRRKRAMTSTVLPKLRSNLMSPRATMMSTGLHRLPKVPTKLKKAMMSTAVRRLRSNKSRSPHIRSQLRLLLPTNLLDRHTSLNTDHGKNDPNISQGM